ncbi:MAG: MFS transporter [Planctomycetes bacterium]|nr:MFS transporter [Planctomycetota bacterium]
MSATRPNPALLCVFHALQMSLFPMAVLTVFYSEHLGMSLRTIMLVQAGFGAAMAAFEFPSGFLADRIGYRRSLVVGALLNAAGWSVYTAAQSVVGVVVAEVMLGVGISLVSGTDAALLYESLLEDGREAEYGTWMGRVRFWGQLGEGTAALVAGVVYAFWARLPFALEVGVWVVNLWVAWKLVEPARHRPELTSSWRQVRAIVRHVVRESPRLRAVMLLTMALGMCSFVPVWTIQLYAKDAGLTAAWLGVLWALGNYNVALGSLFATRVETRLGLWRLLLLCVALIALGYAGLGLVHGVAGVLFYFALTTMRGLFGPPLGHVEQRLIASGDRAGFLSLRSFAFRLCFLPLGPAVGAAMDRHGQHAVLLVLGAALLAVVLAALTYARRVGALQATRQASSAPAQ